MRIHSIVLLSLRSLISAALLILPHVGTSATTNFFTDFETTQGYTTNLPLAGQQGWIGYVYSTNKLKTNALSAGNGLLSSGLAGSAQAAYVGLNPLPTGFNSLVELFQPITNNPTTSGLAIVTFTTQLKIVDSSNGHWDYFDWEFFNSQGTNLFSIEFDNDFYEINFYNSTNGYTYLGPYTAGTEYTLSVAMNFVSNRCAVILNGNVLTNSLPITTRPAVLDLSAISALWQPQNRLLPGNNYMLFDNYRVTSAATPARPQLAVVIPGGNTSASVRVTGENGFRFALEGSTNLNTWSAIGTNTLSNGSATYKDSDAVGKPFRHYRARWVP